MLNAWNVGNGRDDLPEIRLTKNSLPSPKRIGRSRDSLGKRGIVMPRAKRIATEQDRQLLELFSDPEYVKIFRLARDELKASWRMSADAAEQLVLSAIGTPKALADIHAAMRKGHALFDTPVGKKFALARLITRRRVQDRMRSDRTRDGQIPLPDPGLDSHSDDATLWFRASAETGPEHHAQQAQLQMLLQKALACFAKQGNVESRQAELLQRHLLQEEEYRELTVGLNCTCNTLYGRLYDARAAFRQYVIACHPELLEWVSV